MGDTDNITTTFTTENNKNLKWINAAAYAVNVLVTYGIGTSGWFGSPTNSELSAKYQTLITPVGWAFSIWGVIFLAQLVWCVQQFVVPTSVETIGYGYVWVVLAQAVWTVTFSQEWIPLSCGMMLLILWFLYRIVVRNNATTNTIQEYLLTRFPFEIHFGWIVAASAVNVNVALVFLKTSATIQYTAALVSLLVLLVIALLLLWQSRTLPVAVLAWALLGVYSEIKEPSNVITNAFLDSQIGTVRVLAASLGCIVFVAVVATLLYQGWKAMREQHHRTDEATRYVRAPSDNDSE